MYTEECSTILLYALKYELLHAGGQPFLMGSFLMWHTSQIHYSVLRYMKVNLEKFVEKTHDKKWQEVLRLINEEIEKGVRDDRINLHH